MEKLDWLVLHMACFRQQFLILPCLMTCFVPAWLEKTDLCSLFTSFFPGTKAKGTAGVNLTMHLFITDFLLLPYLRNGLELDTVKLNVLLTKAQHDVAGAIGFLG